MVNLVVARKEKGMGKSDGGGDNCDEEKGGGKWMMAEVLEMVALD